MKRLHKAALIALIPFALAGCLTDDEGGAVSIADTDGRLVIFASGKDKGEVEILDTATGKVVTSAFQVSSSGTVDLSNGVLYVLDQSAGVVTGFRDGRVGDAASVTTNANVGTGSNPYGVAELGGKLYVARYNSASILVVRPSDGASIDSISLRGYHSPSDTDAYPEMMGIVAYAGKLFVPIERMNRSNPYWTPADSSLVLVIDPASKAIEQAIALKSPNPFSLSVSGSKLFLACVGSWGSVSDGGIEIVDMATKTARTILTEASRQANLIDVVPVSESKAYVILSDANYTNTVAPLDVRAGTVGTAVAGISSAFGMAFDGKSLWVGNSPWTATPTVVKIDPANGAKLATYEIPYAVGKLVFVP